MSRQTQVRQLTAQTPEQRQPPHTKMKVLLLSVLLVGAVLAEPAFRRQQVQQAQQAPQESEEAPYAPSGWKPSGQRLELPPMQYGAPKEEELDATTEPPTEEPPAEPQQPRAAPKPRPQTAAVRSEKQQVAQGEYYVILPDGRLQRVQFAAKLEASPKAEEENKEDEEEDVEDRAPAPRPAAPRSGNRPVPRSQPARQQAVVPAVPVSQAQYFVVLADGRQQEVQYFGKLEATPAENLDGQDDDEAAAKPAAHPAPAPRRSAPRPAAPRPQAAQRRSQPERQQVQQARPVVLLPQQEPLQEPAVPSSFVAELRFMEVPPIAGPVYSYSQPLVRVQREI
ncbi:hypothetical protein FOCC_FOCC001745 [Frankliniella occidentalis]|uniref:Uncharacterized protein LOC113214412 isoform X1 n=1 Tax=Frankliniella occidentalis TaxID=133901 RepID=A0A9C6XWF8_FRAOC|nr:uncharacterized protein LOC113214412 isoform X1 [Frankliniella occidentalis]XP_052133471.1 uncharacterized protein LOC113214412 isoform X2 [Frankliniella occidentalis]KAE8751498.1 hypothetical protein FOCC_FOCC001745 [Frankliniella occidentalis]